MRIKTNVILWSSLGIYLFFYFLYYPKIYTIFDEACYLDLSYALRKCTVYLEKADIGTLHFPIKKGTHLVSLYPIGNSAFLVPFTFLKSKGLFLYGLLFHLLGYIIFIKVLKEAAISPKYAILYLFYPPHLFFSRTLMSDIPSAFFALLAFYSYQKERYIRMGISLGLSFLIRYASLFLLPIFLIFILGKKSSVELSLRIRHSIKVLLGFLPFLLLVFFYNYIVYGAPFYTGYPTPRPIFELHRYIAHLLFYLLSLSIFYPLMIVPPFFYKKAYRFEILISFISIIFFYILSSFAFSLYTEYSLKDWVKTSILTVRYFFPIIPLLLIAYSSVCEKYLSNLFVPIWVLLIAISIGIQHYHNQYLNSQAEFKDSLYSHTTEHSIIIGNEEVTELISNLWGKRTLVLWKEIDLSTLPKEDLWLAILIRLDKPNTKLLELRDSVITKFNTQLVKEISRIDKKFELYKLEQTNQ